METVADEIREDGASIVRREKVRGVDKTREPEAEVVESERASLPSMAIETVASEERVEAIWPETKTVAPSVAAISTGMEILFVEPENFSENQVRPVELMLIVLGA